MQDSDDRKTRGSPALREVCEPEWLDWYRLTPQERWRESSRLMELYLAFGGSLDHDTDDEIVEPAPPDSDSVDQRHVIQTDRADSSGRSGGSTD